MQIPSVVELQRVDCTFAREGRTFCIQFMFHDATKFNDDITNLMMTSQLDVHRTHTPRCEVKKIIALWRMHAVMQGWKEVGCED